VNAAFVPVFANVPGFNAAKSELTSPVLYDANTTIGRSAPIKQGSAPAAGVPVGSDQPNLGSDAGLVPPTTFTPTAAGTDVIYTEVKSVNLTHASGVSVHIGYFDSQKPGLPHSPGKVSSNSGASGQPAEDFPASSFFNIFVEVDLPLGGATARIGNTIPLVVSSTNIQTLPPKVVYIHDPSTWVPMFFLNKSALWNPGDFLGFLVLAGHGAGMTVLKGSNGLPVLDQNGNYQNDPANNDLSSFENFMGGLSEATTTLRHVTNFSDSGAGSFRQGILDAISGTGSQTILLEVVTTLSQYFINLQSPLPAIAPTAAAATMISAGGSIPSVPSITITGQGPSAGGIPLQITGNGSFPILVVKPASPSFLFGLSNVTLRSGGGAGPGAGVYFEAGTSFSSFDIFQSNQPSNPSGNGGGAAVGANATADMNYCEFYFNGANNGAAIDVAGTLNFRNGLIDGSSGNNSVISAEPGAKLTVTDTLFFSNFTFSTGTTIDCNGSTTQCTVIGDDFTQDSGGSEISVRNGASANFGYDTVWMNSDSQPAVQVDSTSSIQLVDTIVTLNNGGNTNFTVNPNLGNLIGVIPATVGLYPSVTAQKNLQPAPTSQANLIGIPDSFPVRDVSAALIHTGLVGSDNPAYSFGDSVLNIGNNGGGSASVTLQATQNQGGQAIPYIQNNFDPDLPATIVTASLVSPSGGSISGNVGTVDPTTGLVTLNLQITPPGLVTVQFNSPGFAPLTLPPFTVTGPAASISVTAGGNQTAPVTTTFGTPLQATVLDAVGDAVPNVNVTFTAPSSGPFGMFGATNSVTVMTNTQGVATAPAFTAGPVAGGYSVTASVTGVGVPAAFSLTNTAGAAASITATAGGGQSAPDNTAFGTALQATVHDAFNNPVPNATVTFTAPGSGSSGTFPGLLLTAQATTNASGVATAPMFTANGTAGGPYIVTATVAGVVTPANFSLTNSAAATISYSPLILPATLWNYYDNVPNAVSLDQPLWSVAPGSTLAPGLALNSATGELAGKLLYPGLFSFSIEATAGLQTAITQVSLNIPSPMASQFTSNLWLPDPINTSTGELTDFISGFDLGGPLGLSFECYYSSQLAANGFSGALGTNWMHNFETKLSPSAAAALATLANGKTVRFQMSSGTWVLQRPEPFPYQLTNSGNQYQLLDPTTSLIYTFSSSGALTAIADRNGNMLTIAQGANGPTDIADGLGRTLHLTYTAGQLSAVTDQAGRTISFGHTGANLTSFTDANGAVTTYAYTAPSLLTGTTRPDHNTPYTQTYNGTQVVQQADSLGNATILTYNLATDASSATDPRGNLDSYTSQDFSNIITHTDAHGHSTLFTYDQNFHRTSVTDRNGAQTGIAYDAASGFPTTITDAAGNTTTYQYTAQAQRTFTFYSLTKITFADGTSVSLAYGSMGNLASITDQLGHMSSYTHNAQGELLTVTNPAGGVTRVTYNPDGTVATLQSPAGDVTAYSYDAYKRLSGITFADQTSLAFAYDADDRPLTVTDERGKVTAFAYDGNGNQTTLTDALNDSTTTTYDTNDEAISIRNPIGQTAAMQYDQVGSLTAYTNAAGEIESYAYDALNRLISATDPAGDGPSFAYDNEGNLVAASDGLSNTVTFVVDKLGQTTRATTPLGETFSQAYDALGRVVSATNPLSQTTTFGYDGRGAVTSVSMPGEISATYAHDALGFVTAIADPNGNTWTQAHDSTGRLLSISDPLGQTTTFTYDVRNRLTGAAAPTGSMQVTYDAAGREVQRRYSDGTSQNFTYDDDNRLTGGDGVVLAYDAAGRMISSNGLAITRDAAGRIATLTYAPGKTVTYTYNARGLLQRVSDWAAGSVTLNYDKAARLVSISRATGLVTQYGYDQNGRIATISEVFGNQAALANIALQRDATGKVISAQRSVPQQPAPAAGVLPLGYNSAHELSQATYDGLGRLTNYNGNTYTWDLESELTGYSGPNGSATFTYDSFGMRTASTVANGTSQSYVVNYATAEPAVSIARSAGADQRYYVYLPNGALLYAIEAADNSHHYYHFDEIGSTTFLTNDHGAITDQYGITPYGETVTVSGSTVNPFTWLGRWGVIQEGATGLYYMRFREYDSSTARFLSRDPVHRLDPQSLNPYQYATANPVSNIDPIGLKGGSADLVAAGVPGLNQLTDAWGAMSPITGYTVSGFGANPGTNILSPLGGTLLGASELVQFRAGKIDQVVEKTLILYRQVKSLEGGESITARGGAALWAIEGSTGHPPTLPALEEASQELKNAGTALKVVGTAAQVATVTVDAIEYSNELDEAQNNYDKYISQSDQIYNAKLKHLKKLYSSGQISAALYHSKLKLVLSESQAAEDDSSWFQTIDQALAGGTFLEHGLVTFTPIPPAALDATSKAIAGTRK